MMDCVYYNDFIRCYRSGRVERIHKQRYKNGWYEVENIVSIRDGYNTIRIDGKNIRRQRLIAYCFLGLKNIVGKSGGDDCIDHINGNKLDNRVENLRITTHQKNNQNQTRAKGYCWIKHAKKWIAYIVVNYKRIHLGYYDTKEDAHQAYLNAKPIYHIH